MLQLRSGKLGSYHVENENRILSPALLYDLDALENNIQAMIRIAHGAQRLWPHVKSHKSADLVKLLMRHGIERFKCATIAEGEMAALCGAKQILLAYPLVGPNIGRFIQLQKTFPNTEFFAIGDDEAQLRLLSDAAKQNEVKVNLLLDINAGLNRTGVAVNRAGSLYRKAAGMPHITVRGMHVYDGNRHETDFSERMRLVQDDMRPVFHLKEELEREHLDCEIMVMGGTPSFPCHSEEKGVYLSPGTCLLQDYGYASLFPDLSFCFAGILLTRVISHPADGYFTMDLGTKSVASDPAVPRAVLAGFEDAETVKHNEEHWVLRMPEGQEARTPAVGTVLYAVPRHICPTSALYASIPAVRNGKVVAEFPVTARDRKLTL